MACQRGQERSERSTLSGSRISLVLEVLFPRKCCKVAENVLASWEWLEAMVGAELLVLSATGGIGVQSVPEEC